MLLLYLSWSQCQQIFYIYSCKVCHSSLPSLVSIVTKCNNLLYVPLTARLVCNSANASYFKPSQLHWLSQPKLHSLNDLHQSLGHLGTKYLLHTIKQSEDVKADPNSVSPCTACMWAKQHCAPIHLAPHYTQIIQGRSSIQMSADHYLVFHWKMVLCHFYWWLHMLCFHFPHQGKERSTCKIPWILQVPSFQCVHTYIVVWQQWQVHEQSFPGSPMYTWHCALTFSTVYS